MVIGIYLNSTLHNGECLGLSFYVYFILSKCAEMKGGCFELKILLWTDKIYFSVVVWAYKMYINQ